MSEIIITPPVQCSVEVVPTVSTGVEIVENGQVVVEAICPAAPVVEFGLTATGLRGPQGIPGPVGPGGPNEIGGFPVAVADAKEKDLLQLKSWSWQNTPQEALTDGGNF
jgi:hypothetical protein